MAPRKRRALGDTGAIAGAAPAAAHGTASVLKREGSLYELLHVDADADAATLRRAYLVLARELHPDKHPEDPRGATVAFQQLKRAFDILSDPARRECYDSGLGDGEEGEGSNFYDARAFVGRLFRRIPAEDFLRLIDEHTAEYQGSPEERADVLKHVRKHKGDATHLLDHICLSNDEDVDRFVKMVHDALDDGSLARGLRAKFDATLVAMRRKAQRERKLWEKDQQKQVAKGKCGGGDTADLALALRSNAARRSSGSLLSRVVNMEIPDDPLAGQDLDKVRRSQQRKRPASQLQ